MIQLQNPNVPEPTRAIEIDKAIYELQLVLDVNLDWLTHDYARCYRHLDRKEHKLYFPEIYIGGDNKSYHSVTPDNDKKGLCFFVVGKERIDDFERSHNYLKYDVGIVFWVNLEKIDSDLLKTEYFRQNLISDAREILTRRSGGLSFNLKIKEAVTEFKEVYKEFDLSEKENYSKAPYAAFRINCEFVMSENCGDNFFDPAKALLQNVSESDILDILLPTIDFSIDANFNSLTEQQKTDLISKL